MSRLPVTCDAVKCLSLASDRDADATSMLSLTLDAVKKLSLLNDRTIFFRQIPMHLIVCYIFFFAVLNPKSTHDSSHIICYVNQQQIRENNWFQFTGVLRNTVGSCGLGQAQHPLGQCLRRPAIFISSAKNFRLFMRNTTIQSWHQCMQSNQWHSHKSCQTIAQPQHYT